MDLLLEALELRLDLDESPTGDASELLSSLLEVAVGRGAEMSSASCCAEAPSAALLSLPNAFR